MTTPGVPSTPPDAPGAAPPAMSPERWARVTAVLHDALDQAPAARAAFLDQACAGDAALRREVTSLIDAATGGGDTDTLAGARDAVAAAAAAFGAAQGRGGDLPDRRALAARLAAALEGSYAIADTLGRGGMSTVFLARDLRHRRRVALKVLDAALSTVLGPERFRREIETAAGLSHPHILPLFDSGAADGLLYFVMPHVPGGTLRDRLTRQAAAGDPWLPADEVVRITREVARALDYAHRHGVVHRDVKPENVLLDEDGHALVADFGIARAARDAAEDGRRTEPLTGAGVLVGTPAYMSPEQWLGDADVNGASDQYALACVAYELLAGAPAFASGRAAAATRRLTRPPPSLATRRPDLPPTVDAALARGFAYAPEARYPTATALVDALAAALQAPAGRRGGEAALPRPVGGRRAWRAVGAAVALAGAVAGGVWGLRRYPAGGAPAAPLTLAVLPFENLGDSADAYLADGITDEVRGTLASLAGLRVIAGASSRQYRGTTKPPDRIARELGARFLLVGRVGRDRGPDGVERVRIAPELVDATGGPAPTTRWAQGFDVPRTDVVRVQGDVAARVANELQVALAAGEQRLLATRPTGSLDAYDLYLRGQAALGRGGLDDLRQAVPLLDAAVRRDPTFALAWAGLATANTSLYNIDHVRTAEHRDAARQAADRALALAPDLPEVRAAVAHYTTYVRKEPARALADLAAARARAPYHALLLRRVANAERALGHLEASVARGEEVLRLDPRSSGAYYWQGLSLLDLRRYPEARAAFDRTVALQPAAVYARVKRALVDVADGDLARARAVLGSSATPADAGRLAATVGWMGYDAVWLLDSATQRLVRARGTAAFDADDRANGGLVLARLFALGGDAARARAYADTAAAAFAGQVRELAANPQVAAELRARYALALAYAGRGADATREAEAAAAAVPLGTGEHPIAYNVGYGRVLVALVRGDRERALAQLAPLLRVPGVLSPGWLRVDPTFGPLRGDPRFERLAAGR